MNNPQRIFFCSLHYAPIICEAEKPRMEYFMSDIVVAALYQFKSWPDFGACKDDLYKVCQDNGIKGSLLIASEGINGTISGSREGIDNTVAYITSQFGFDQLEYKESFADFLPFYRLKIYLKKEIVTLGVSGINPTCKTGDYVDPEDWNEVIQDPDVLLLDTRNTYETDVGLFKNALDPRIKTFREFPQFVKTHLDPEKQAKVAMYCTGGIRCEKASALLLNLGFETVYQLKGGILNYFDKIPLQDSLWQGECFVFDNRVTVDQSLNYGNYDQCFACRMPLSNSDKQSAKYQKGVSCPYCHDQLSADQLMRFSERQKQVELAKQRNYRHIGPK